MEAGKGKGKAQWSEESKRRVSVPATGSEPRDACGGICGHICYKWKKISQWRWQSPGYYPTSCSYRKCLKQNKTRQKLRTKERHRLRSKARFPRSPGIETLPQVSMQGSLGDSHALGRSKKQAQRPLPLFAGSLRTANVYCLWGSEAAPGAGCVLSACRNPSDRAQALVPWAPGIPLESGRPTGLGPTGSALLLLSCAAEDPPWFVGAFLLGSMTRWLKAKGSRTPALAQGWRLSYGHPGKPLSHPGGGPGIWEGGTPSTRFQMGCWPYEANFSECLEVSAEPFIHLSSWRLLSSVLGTGETKRNKIP